MKIILLGNAGAGKSTMARRLIGDRPDQTGQWGTLANNSPIASPSKGLEIK